MLQFPPELDKLHLTIYHGLATREPGSAPPTPQSSPTFRPARTNRLIARPDRGILYADTLSVKKLGLRDGAVEGLYGMDAR